jgi:hypothetical protein
MAKLLPYMCVASSMAELRTAVLKGRAFDNPAANRRTWARSLAQLSGAFCLFAVWCAGLGTATTDALAGWTPAVPVGGAAIGEVVYDAHNVPWVTFTREHLSTNGPRELFAARLTNNYRFAQVRKIPSMPGMINFGPELTIGPNGLGDLLWQFYPPSEKAPPIGVATAAWHPGNSVGRPLVLTQDRYRGPSMAINARGTDVVLWATENAIEVARTRYGRLLGEQEIPVADGHVPNSVDVLPREADDFQASWQLRAGGSGRNEFDLMAVDDAHANGGGVFSAPTLTPWPTSGPGAYGTSEAQIASDARGDQVLVWEGSVGASDSDIYVASRRAGKPFRTAQLIGQAQADGAVAAMGPSGRITVMWSTVGSVGIVAAAGYAGHALGPSRPFWVGRAGATGATRPRLAITPRNQAIAVWGVWRGINQTTVEASASNDGLHFTKPTVISRTFADIHNCGNPELLTLDHHGNALAGWSCTLHRHGRVNEYSRYIP